MIVNDEAVERAQRDLARAATLKAFMRDPVIAEVFREARDKAITEWEQAPTIELREKQHAVVLALKDIERRFAAIESAGKHGEAVLERAASPVERVRPTRR